MAVALLRDLLGDAIAELLDRHEDELSRHLERVAQWLGDAAEPPPGVELRSIDGSKFTGVGVFERNRVVMLLAIRHGGAQRPRHATLVRDEFDLRERSIDPRDYDRDGGPFDP